MMRRIQGSNGLGDPADRNRVLGEKTGEENQEPTGGFGVPYPITPWLGRHGLQQKRERERGISSWGRPGGRHGQAWKVGRCALAKFGSRSLSPPAALPPPSIQPSSHPAILIVEVSCLGTTVYGLCFASLSSLVEQTQQTLASNFSSLCLAIMFLSRTARQGQQASDIACLDRAGPHHTYKRLQYALSVSLPTLPQPTRDMTSGTAVLRRNPETR